MIARIAPLLGLVSVAACAAPSSFDGLTGGNPKPTNELRTRAADPTMDAPRPISPVSVSWVSTLRPTFKWQAAAGTTGAVIEVCKTRACDGEEVRRVEADGETVTVPEDLEAGVWFWRVFGMSKDRVGTKPSATWEVLVRGAAANGSSDAPSGGMVDINGDGLADLLVASSGYDMDEADQTWKPFPLMMVWLGKKDGTLDIGNGFWMDDGAVHVPTIGGGIDTDGDGFTDVVRTLQDRQTGEFEAIVEYGSAGKPFETDDGKTHVDYIDWSKYGFVMLPGVKTLPSVREAGDVNGDGFGDVLAFGAGAAVVGLGGAKGTSTSMPLFFGGGGTGPNAIIGAFDADGDGLSDVALASPNGGSPLAAGRGDRERIQISADLVARGPGAVEKAVAIASGDFDGDGIADLAATVPMDGKRNVCFWKGSRDKLFDPLYCVPGMPNDATYGDRLIVGDLAGKGRDNLLVSAGEGATAFVDVFELDGDSMMIDEIAVPGIGSKLTMMWPGRPGKARWATVDAQGTAVLVFEGRTVLQSIAMVGRGMDWITPVHALR
jgi:hypothetical protein